ncbi:hypothetical protein CUMW_222230 [Citrus unshiu]|uniref:Uncharacterized protein n=1 Tax=Citrus unshiu TaxID=55188 RepID=A0A2H5QEF4_CITUN|nr:hypothetical protein CUMW_222230 [Citrus unshiu]
MEVNSLSKFAVRGQWDNIVQAYENNPMSREAKLTNLETQLYTLQQQLGKPILYIRLGGNHGRKYIKPLGNEAMCHCTASKDRELISVRNNDSETPLFLAALHGNMDAFLCLRSFNQAKDNRQCRKNNGETILHSAISGEYFSIAFQIMRAYPDLVNSVNENGLTRLHILASKPTAFKRGSRLGLFDHKTKGEANDEESPECNRSISFSKNDDKCGQFFPPNYAACFLFFWLLMKALPIVLGLVQGLKFMEKKDQQSGRNETAILIAAKMGVAEMVKKILDTFPVAMQDMDSEKKNLVLLAVENRQTSIYKLLLDWKILR